MKWFVLSLLLVAVVAPSASAVTLVNTDGSAAQPFQSWASKAAVPMADAQVSVDRDMSTCLGRPACFSVDHLHVSNAVGSFTLYHELGHAFDAYALNWPRRHRLKVALGYTRETVWYQPGVPGPSETFADAYAVLALYGGCGGWMVNDLGWGYGYKAVCSSLRAVRKIIREAA